MIDKIKEILGSVRFWILTLTGVVALLEAQVAGTLDMAFVLKVTEAWLVAVVGLGTLDSVAIKFGGALRGRR